MFYNLFKILNTSTLNVGGFLEGFKKGPKGIIKNIFIILFAIYVIAVMIGMYTAYMIATYKFLAASGNQEAMPFITMLVALLIIMFFGFTSVAASYYTGSSEEFLMSLPLTPGQFFGAKFAVSFVSDAIMGLGMFAISSIVYGVNEGLLTNPLFYIGFLVAALAFSLAAVFVIYLLFILILYFIPALRKKKLMTVVATVLLIAFCIFYGLMNSSISMSFSNPKFMGEKMGSSIEKLFGLSDKMPVFMYISGALKGKILPILILAALSALILFVLVPFFGKLYIKTLDGFADVKSKKITAQKAEEVIEKDVRSVSVFHALFVRDYRNVVREPAFFANGPLFVYLFPVIFILSFSVGFIASGEGLGVIISAFKSKLAELTPESLKSAKYFVTLGSAAFVVFTGTFANLATTSFSREGKSLNDLKAMPIDFNLIVKVKFWHALLYVGIANVIMIFLLTLAYFLLQVPFTFTDLFSICFMTVLLSGSVSLLLIFIDMFIDTLNPKLNWETPMAASKQNFNVLWSMLLSMLTVGLVVILVVFALPKSMISLVILSIIYVIIAAPVGAAYFRYAEKRLKEM
jgi:ABC-2 type transport system permease protein